MIVLEVGNKIKLLKENLVFEVIKSNLNTMKYEFKLEDGSTTQEGMWNVHKALMKGEAVSLNAKINFQKEAKLALEIENRKSEHKEIVQPQQQKPINDEKEKIWVLLMELAEKLKEINK